VTKPRDRRDGPGGAIALLVVTLGLAVGADRLSHRFASHLSAPVVAHVAPVGSGVVAVVAVATLWRTASAIRTAVRERRTAPRRVRPEGEQKVYTVDDGDTLWAIAAMTLGAPRRWLEIAALNVGARQIDGRVFDVRFLRAGWQLFIPPSDGPPAPTADPSLWLRTTVRQATGTLGALNPGVVVRGSAELRPGPPTTARDPFIGAAAPAHRATARTDEPVAEPAVVDDPPRIEAESVAEGCIAQSTDSEPPASTERYEDEELAPATGPDQDNYAKPDDYKEPEGPLTLESLWAPLPDSDAGGGRAWLEDDPEHRDLAGDDSSPAPASAPPTVDEQPSTAVQDEEGLTVDDGFGPETDTAPTEVAPTGTAPPGAVEPEELTELGTDVDDEPLTLPPAEDPRPDAMAVLTQRIIGRLPPSPSAMTTGTSVGPAPSDTEPVDTEDQTSEPVAIPMSDNDPPVIDGSMSVPNGVTADVPEPSAFLDQALVELVVEWCHSPQAERLALGLRAAASAMVAHRRVPIAARIGTRTVELWFDPSYPVTDREPVPEPWAAWPGTSEWVMTEDIDLAAYAAESTRPSPAPALVPIGFDHEGLVLVNVSRFPVVAHNLARAAEYGQAIRTILSPRTRAPWTDGVRLAGDTASIDESSVVIDVVASGKTSDHSATGTFVVGGVDHAEMLVGTDGRVEGLGSLVVTPSPYTPSAVGRKRAKVHVLGPIGVSGPGVGAFSERASELVAFLALEGGKASAAKAMDAIFDHRRASRSATYRVRKAAIEALGTAPNGSPRLRPEGKQGLQLVDTDCDWQVFRSMADADPAAALGLVTGPPLDGVDSDWARAWRVEMARVIAACAVELARDHLAAGSPEGAREAARRGLLAVPYDDGLWVVLLDAAATAGLGAVGEQWEEIVAVLGDGREASVPPSVMAAHRRIKAVAAV
jgi:hypothetical protein